MGRVAEFEAELLRRAKPQFATWHAIDRHNHTPASDDYKDRGPDVVDRLAEKIRTAGLAVVMFTDHNQLPDAGFVNQIADKTGRLVRRLGR
jgi:hypothetical protein